MNQESSAFRRMECQIDTYISQKNFNFVNICRTGDYILSPKYKMAVKTNYFFPLFSKVKNPRLSELDIYLENEVAYVYIKK
jgi:hypothetical protein